MRRYGVRFLVAVLTFSFGVALSFALGVFTVGHTRHKFAHKRADCRRFSRDITPAPVIAFSPFNAPLKLEYLGPNNSQQKLGQVLVTNTTEQTVTSYTLTGERVRREDGGQVEKLELVFNQANLQPRESRLGYVNDDILSTVTLELSRVEFQDGSIWNTPH